MAEPRKFFKSKHQQPEAPSSIPEKNVPPPKLDTRPPKPYAPGLLSNLMAREMGYKRRGRGCHQGGHPKAFDKLPGRLGFNLRNLTQPHTMEGYVFLGFLKSGKLVVSYTHELGTDDHSIDSINVYKLQWWLFVPYRKLKLLAEVRLFGDEAIIGNHLFLTFCEFPCDDSIVVIHGLGFSNGEEKRQCYVTVTAVPPCEPCEDCSQLAILHMQADSSVAPLPPRCLAHSYTVHTRYDLAPPYPAFNPRVFLQIDGVVVLNTGDFLVGLGLELEDSHAFRPGAGQGLYSPRAFGPPSFTSLESCMNIDEERLSVDSFSLLNCSTSRGSDGLLHASTSENNGAGNAQSPRESAPPLENMYCLIGGKSGKENHGVPIARSPVGSGMGPLSPLRIPEEESGSKHGSGLNQHREGPPPRTLSTETQSGGPQSSHSGLLGHNPDPLHEVCDPDTDRGVLCSNISFECTPTCYHTPCTALNCLYFTSDDGRLREDRQFERPQRPPLLTRQLSSTPASPSSPRILSLATPEAKAYIKSLCSPVGSSARRDTDSCTSSSCISSAIILQTESQCFTYSVRRYTEIYNLDPSAEMEADDLSLAYHTVLPIEARGANYCPLRMLSRQAQYPQTPCLVVKQLTLDIEHYLVDAIRTKAEWGFRYLSFADYDAQIVDICSESFEVIVVVFVMLRARPAKEWRGMLRRGPPKLHETTIHMTWNLKTGAYNTIYISDLAEITKEKFQKAKMCYNSGSKLRDDLQQTFLVPKLFPRSVRVLTNEAVIRGKSLKLLVDQYNYTAILL